MPYTLATACICFNCVVTGKSPLIYTCIVTNWALTIGLSIQKGLLTYKIHVKYIQSTVAGHEPEIKQTVTVTVIPLFLTEVN